MNGEGAGRARLLGALLMAGAALPALLFLAGASRRSYLALALPVGAGLGLVSALAFWVGCMLVRGEDDGPAGGGAAPETAADA